MSHGITLASFASDLRWEDVPASLQAKLLDHVVDTIGVMFAGLDMPSCESARLAAAEWGDADHATLVGLDTRAPASSAAFVNALHGRIHTYDDTYEPGTLHPGSPVIATCLAMAERLGADGRCFLGSAIAGYEVAARVAAAVSPGHYAYGFHNTGTCSVFGTTAAAAKLLGLDKKKFAETLGLAGAAAAGLRQHQIDGSMFDSALHGARAAQSGVMLAQMGAHGAGGPPGILDGPMGFCKVMGPSGDPARLDAGLGSRYEFSQMTIKPYPTCRFAHGPTAAALDLRQAHDIKAEQIASVEIAAFRQSIEVCDRPALNSALDATFSHQYSVTLALVHGAVSLDMIRHPETAGALAHDLLQRVKVVHDAELEQDFPRCWPHRVSIVMRDGRRYATRIDYPPGRTSPISASVVDAKFIQNSAPYLGDDGAIQALEALRSIAAASDIRPVARLLSTRQTS
ncbi:MmgE/PrpD family protein [Pollutimonas sp. M17]|uniref:MmgE/PrpD family protein n=1 Tax=Pollutimonas sp. M17 TaxID=2962065 RepID=UPI0021F45326|nr:MmgE/PrpD family protein [Pollutimonas sp. M17]UYO93563.1 MmgE/PrpD family protein [Pollutimonas sp. M17]